MAIPLIDQLPPAPTPADPEDVFDTKAYDMVAALGPFIDQTNAVAQLVDGEGGRSQDLLDAATAQADRSKAQADISAREADRSRSAANEANASKQAAAASADTAKDYKNLTEALLENAIVGVSGPVVLQSQVITEDLTIPTGFNALIIGDFRVQPGVTIKGEGTAVLRGL